MKKFKNKEELYEYLKSNDLYGLDSEYSLSTQKLKRIFKANGVHINKWWVRTDPSWMCSVCKRAKKQIVKINKHGDLSGQLHEHHDHMADFLKLEFDKISSKREVRIADNDADKFISRISFGLAAYENTLVCSDCNKADADAKKIVKAHKYFSFSPKDIASFIIVKDNCEHTINEQKAIDCYISQKSVYKRRLELAAYIASIAADNDHWYEESRINSIESIYWNSNRNMRIYGIDELPGFNEDLLFQSKQYKSDLSQWRRKNRLSKYKPTQGDIEHMANTRGEKWNKLDDDWKCPICDRSKESCVTKTKKGTWLFNTVGKSFLDTSSLNWCTTKTICDSCHKVYTLLQKEVDVNGVLSYTHHNIISEIELKKSILKVYSHNSHDVNNSYVDNILKDLTLRIENELYTFSKLAPS